MALNKHICIIDDDPICVYTTKLMLESAGVFNQISIYTNGKEAFDGLKHSIGSADFPEYVLLDINMPIWDAWDFLDELSKSDVTFNSNIFVVSSSNDPEDEQRARSYSLVKGFLLKPIQISQLNFHL
jgi:CheY-like chemotaxis protein